MQINPILANGYGGVSSVSEAQRIAEAALKNSAPGTFAASLVIVNEGFKAAESTISDMFKHAQKLLDENIRLQNENTRLKKQIRK